MIKKIGLRVLVGIISLHLIACETEITPPATSVEQKLTVEGYIEAGDGALPPYVLLTRSVAFFSKIDNATFNNLFVHDAQITVSEGNRSRPLQELCFSDLTPEQQALVAQTLGVPLTGITANICVYLDLEGFLNGQGISGEEGKTYNLRIEAENKVLTATTTIPNRTPLDSVFYESTPDPANDTLVQISCFFSEPGATQNYYRYFTQRNSEAEYPVQVFDDALTNGTSYKGRVFRGEATNADFDPITSGFFWRGDTINIKFIGIDKPSYDFWNTLNYSASNQGPFSNVVRVKSNIVGDGLGVWSGQAIARHQLIVPR